MRRFLIICLAASAAGCGYHAGSINPNPYHAVAIPIFQNSSLVPQIQAQVTDAVIKRFQADGSLRVASTEAADVVVEGRIVEVTRDSLRFQKVNQSVSREYRLTLVATVTLRDRRTGKAIFEGMQARGRTDFFITADLQAAEAQALPLAADDLAKRIVERVAEGW